MDNIRLVFLGCILKHFGRGFVFLFSWDMRFFDNFEVFLDCFAADGTCMLNGLRHGQKFDRYKTIHNT